MRCPLLRLTEATYGGVEAGTLQEMLREDSSRDVLQEIVPPHEGPQTGGTLLNTRQLMTGTTHNVSVSTLIDRRHQPNAAHWTLQFFSDIKLS